MARKRFNFWLDDKRPEDWTINELITSLKGQGQFTRAIRDGLRLIVDLRAEKTDVLFELFPNLKPQIKSSSDDGSGNNDLKQIKSMLEIVVADRRAGEYVMKSAAPALPKLAAPVAVVAQAAPASADDIVDNFLSMFQ